MIDQFLLSASSIIIRRLDARKMRFVAFSYVWNKMITLQ